MNKNTNDAWFGSAQGIYKYNTEKDTVEFFNSTNDLLTIRLLIVFILMLIIGCGLGQKMLEFL